MSNGIVLAKIANLLREHLQQYGAHQPLGSMGVFHCRLPQSLREVPLCHAGFVLVVSGTKTVRSEFHSCEYEAGQLLLFPAGATLHIENYPAPKTDYLALAVIFSPDVLERFIHNYTKELDLWSQTPKSIATAPEEFIALLLQWVEVSLARKSSALLAIHRQQELLLLLTQYGLAGNIFLRQQASWQQKVAACIALDISRNWLMEDVAARFACSTATLRRRLESESCSFRQVLETVRLSFALGLLQESNWTVLRVAQAVGYESPSRFSERFRLRFGMSPQALRVTRVNTIRENMLSLESVNLSEESDRVI